MNEAMRKLSCPERASMADLLLSHGRTFKPAPLPQGFRRMKPKHCFNNSLHHALDGKLTYCEGYALRPGLFPLQHAWLCDDTGNVIDVTWDKPGECTYFGIPLLLDHVADVAMRTGVAGVLANHLDEFKLERGEYEVNRWLHPIALLLPIN
jgi:hypothetical protein